MNDYSNHRYKKLPDNYLEETGFEYTFNSESFDEWFADIQAFAEQNRIPTNYVEEEFILEGDFIPVHLTFQEDIDYPERNDNDYDPSKDDTGCDF